MAQITLNKPSGGQLTIAPEDGTSTETITIPSVGVGKVLQVVSANFTNQLSGSGSFDVLSVNITPTNSTSKFFISFSGSVGVSGDAYDWGLRVKSNGTVVNALIGDAYGTSGRVTVAPTGTDNGPYENSNAAISANFNVFWTHGQSSTQTITVEKVNSNGATTVIFGRTSWGGSTDEQLVFPTFLTVWEIA